MRDKRAAFIGLLILAAWGCATEHSAPTSDHAKEHVLQAATEFYAALNAMFTGDLDPMKEVWSHEDDVAYMDPGGGYHLGWDQVLASWETQAALKLGGEVKPEDLHITVGRDLAVTYNYEKGENTNEAGEVEVVSIRATNLFRREDGKWKMIGHHTDLLPFLEK